MKAVSSGIVSTLTAFAYDEGGRLLGEYDDAGNALTEYVYLDDMPIAAIRDTMPYYLVADHLGTPRQAVDPATNAVLWRWDLLENAFGTESPDEDMDGDNTTFALNQRFPGHYYDAELGLHYNYSRDYEPVTGRYIESDVIGLQGGANTYRYANTSPLVYQDPDGNAAVAGAAVCFIPGVGWASCAAAAVGTAAVGIVCYATGTCQWIVDKIVDMCLDEPDCARIRQQCIQGCSDFVLQKPRRKRTDWDSGGNFDRCLRQCLDRNGC